MRVKEPEFIGKILENLKKESIVADKCKFQQSKI